MARKKKNTMQEANSHGNGQATGQIREATASPAPQASTQSLTLEIVPVATAGPVVGQNELGGGIGYGSFSLNTRE